MPRSRKRPRLSAKPLSVPSWTESAVSELLAWAEHCRQKYVSGSHFESTIINHLKHTMGLKFSYAQVDEKIRELAETSATPLSHIDYKFLYKTFGKESLIRCVVPDRAARKVLLARVNELGNDESSKPSSPKPVQRDRRQPLGRVSNVADDNESPDETRLRKRRLNTRKYRSKRRQQHTTQFLDLLQTPSTVDMVPSHERQTSIASETATQRASEDPLSVPNKTSDFPDDLLTLPSVQSSPCPLYDTFDEPIQGISEIERTSSESMAAETDQRYILSTPQDEAQDLRRDISYLSQQLLQEREKSANLERKLATSENAMSIIKHENPALLTEQLELLEEELEIWKTKARDSANWSYLVKSVNKQQEINSARLLEGQMNHMRRYLRDYACELANCPVDANKLLSTAPPALKILYQRVLGDGTRLVRTVGCDHLIRALITAALCDWVFECELWESCLSGSLLLETILQQLIRFQGEDAAKAIHFSAHEALLNGEYFQKDVIPHRAQVLAGRFYELLDSNLSTCYLNDRTVDHIREQLQQAQDYLVSIFAHALKVKAYTLVSNNVFEVICPCSHIEVDRETVQVELPAAQILQTRSAEPSCVVLLPLAPGLRSHECKRKLVDYNSFRKPGKDLVGPYDVIVMPVILEDATVST